jgi:hypothetical protein
MFRNHISSFRFGQITLPIILLIGGILVTIAVSGVFISQFFSSGGLGERLSERAEASAQAGIRDAILKISRDKDFFLGFSSYSLSVGNDTVQISVDRMVPNSSFYNYDIIAEGTAFNRKKKIVAVIIANQITGEVRIQSISEESVN